MAKIYTIGGIKGGTGKTTIAVNLAILFSQEANNDVLLVDADDQESSTLFTSIRSQNQDAGYTCIKLSNRSVYDNILRLKNKYKTIIIDAGGRDTTSQRAALSVSNIALFPFPPRSLDIWTISKLNNMIDEVMSINPNLRLISFINKGDGRGSDNIDVINILKEQKALKYIDSILMARKAYANAIAEGKGIIGGKKT